MIAIPKVQFEGYIFDLDGTIVDSMPMYYRAWSHAFKENGAKFHFTWQQCLAWGGKSAAETVLEANQIFGENLDLHSVRTIQQSFVEKHIHEVKVHEEMVDVIQSIYQRYPLSIASGNCRKNVYYLLEKLNLLHFFPIIVSQEDVTLCKPAPDLFLLAAQKMEVPPHKCLVFEDSQAGIDAAKAAGMQYVQVKIENPDLV